MAPKSAVKKVKLDNSNRQSKPIEKADDSSSEDDHSVNLSEESDVNEREVDPVDDILGTEADDESSDEEISENDTERKVKKSDKFTTAMSAILGSRVKAHDAANPILIRNKRPAQELEEIKAERKARKVMRAEKMQHQDKARVRDVIPKDPEEAGDVLSNEKKLRKIAQRGAVKLLNAIHSAQSAAIQNLDGPQDKNAESAKTELSKEKFLDIIRMS